MSDELHLDKDLPALLQVSFLELIEKAQEDLGEIPLGKTDIDLLNQIFTIMVEQLDDDPQRWVDTQFGTSMASTLFATIMDGAMEALEIEDIDELTLPQATGLVKFFLRYGSIIGMVSAVLASYISKMGGNQGLEQDADELADFINRAKALTGDS